MIVVIVVIVVALFLILSYTFRLFKIEKLPDEEAAAAPAAEAGVGEEQQKTGEMVDLFDYFSEDEANKEALPQNEPPAEYDKLSELKIGRGYQRDCQMLLDRALTENEVYAVAYLDFDRFRFINSLKGYSIGDYVLSRFAQDIKDIFPENSQFTRISADHFVICFPLISDGVFEEYTEQIKRVCDKIRGDVAIKGVLRVCMGVAVTNSVKDYDIGLLICKANIARHCLKVSKSESFALYNESMTTTYLYGESALDDYGENQFGDDFHIYFQPQSDITKNRVVASSALVRWVCEETGKEKERMITSDNGRIPTNNAKVFYHICRSMSRWRKSGKETLMVFIYMLPMLFYLDDVDSLLVKCMSEFQLEGAVIAVLLDKNILRVNPEIAAKQVKKIRDIGVSIGVDGIFSPEDDLSFLDGMAVTYMKLHSSLVDDVDREASRAQALTRLAKMALARGVQPICEGVDSVELVNAVRACGVSLIEGRYTGRPAVADDFSKTLQEYVQKQKGQSSETVILDDFALNKGEFKLF